MDIQYATQHEKKLELTENYLAHLNRAQKERDYYNKNIVNAVVDDSLEDNYKTFTMRSFSFDANALPPTINTKLLSLKRQEELYKEIAPHVDLPFRDITCPKPEELKTS
ncbi:28003_t:CDS:2 [Dentiscutata erythropus]|uniref:28003_t:CDS:1 n=1 Tax=Dentiscutata erythropus TaxID=1348616 RepID=A0A9N9HCG1_9GLOM|nr:28003_t:CDS:2 [Dentiscutata erythropus]